MVLTLLKSERNSAVEILSHRNNSPFLFLGDATAAKDKFFLLNNKITHILNATDEVENFFENDNRFTYLKLNLDDVDDEDIISVFETAHKFINDVEKSKKGAVLVHCFAGISRSSTLVISYLMKHYQMSFQRAWVTI